MMVLVCGGRDYNDQAAAFAALDKLWSSYPISLIVHGDARGADTLAKEWALHNGVHYAAVPALWDMFGKRAGPVRNAIMADVLQPDYCVAFPGGKGTQHMIGLCEKFGIPVYKPYG